MNRSATHVEQRQVIQVGEGEALGFAGVIGMLKIDAPATEGRFVAAVFPEIPPGVLAAPLHRHHNEDEYVRARRCSGDATWRRGDHRRGGRVGTETARSVAHVLERGRRAVPDH